MSQHSPELNTPPQSILSAQDEEPPNLSLTIHDPKDNHGVNSTRIAFDSSSKINEYVDRDGGGGGVADRESLNQAKNPMQAHSLKFDYTSRCLICHAECFQVEDEDVQEKKASLGGRLHVIFILRKLLEIPYSTLELYLVHLGDSFEKWISLCPNCSKIIHLAKEVYDDLLKISRKFKSLKKIVIDKVRESENDTDSEQKYIKEDRKRKLSRLGKETLLTLTEDCRQFVKRHKYEPLINPFPEGDLQATRLLARRSSSSLIPPPPQDENHELTYLYLPFEDDDESATVDDDDGGTEMDSNSLDANEAKGEGDAFELSFDEDEVDSEDDEGNDPTFRFSERTKSKQESETKTSKLKLPPPPSTSRSSRHKKSNPAPSSTTSDVGDISDFVEYSVLNHARVDSSEESESTKRSPYDRGVRFTCPYCENYRFRMLKGEEFCEHLDICIGLKGEKRKKLLCCPICGQFKKTLEERNKFVDHLPACYSQQNVPLNLRIFLCNLCPAPDRKYYKLEGFLQHYAYHKKYIFRCTLCSTKFLDRRYGRQHFRTYHPESMETYIMEDCIIGDDTLPTVPWYCPICPDSVFDSESQRDSHLDSMHPDWRETSSNSSTPTTDPLEVHKCQFCPNPKYYNCRYELELHEGTEHVSQKALFQCDLCSESFRKEKYLQAHKTSKHRLNTLVCEVCGLECLNNKTLECHMQLHQEVRNFPCTQPSCQKSFTTQWFLKCHINHEHGDKEDPSKNPQLCPLCKKVFHKRVYLLKHIKEHHEKKYDITCELCGRGIQTNSHLKRHMSQTHGIGDYGKHKCTHEGCTFVTYDKSYLRQHLSQHAGVPQFKCEYCGKEFYYKSLLQRHELIHTNAESKPYQCEICAKRFPVKNYLYIHMRSHKKEQNDRMKIQSQSVSYHA